MIDIYCDICRHTMYHGEIEDLKQGSLEPKCKCGSNQFWLRDLRNKKLIKISSGDYVLGSDYYMKFFKIAGW